MRKLALGLLAGGLALGFVGARGCASALGSIGNQSAEMSYIEAFCFLAAPICLLAGIVLWVTARRLARRRATAHVRARDM